ncbi:hypothetical protein PUNSTDRAFT_63856 [Punctularia strigosozonata HHB-11173 SS5]|uniref:uncharacterized protein n=1 Tax=Punctularia strigosozonata (strain HHB-11173) TaxID=741275 RepID=UPI000441656C|nr:uncharacterized protein PUNSTDRAFT_63856 [Punctularia strigosozonata HHB-11173 SS5]EIN10660.1 hypothetical protein PUNSTDRAFT_63856 [Punctularia strigosozonata HHB-11173 SS5]
MPRILRFTNSQRRTIVSALFACTFLASVVTVSASNFLPCPAHPTRNRFADDGSNAPVRSGSVTVEKRPRRWIEETRPNSQ